jgi:hypothetical protein
VPTTAWAERGFCTECGTLFIYRDFTETHGIHIATLDHPGEWPPSLWHSGMESRIPWNTIYDNLPCWDTDGDPELNKFCKAFDELSSQVKKGLLSEEDFAQQKKSLFENGPSV